MPNHIAINMNALTRSMKKRSNKYNAHVVNTSDPNWLEKEGVSTHFNLNVEAKKRYLARQNKKTRRARRSYRR
jgi:hypothetical protein